MKETRVGTVVNYFSRPMVAAVRIDKGSLSRGEILHFKGRTTDLYQRADSLHIDGVSVTAAPAGAVVGVAVGGRVRRRDGVSRVEEAP